MLVITDIQVIEVDRDYCELAFFNNDGKCYCNTDTAGEPCNIIITRENIYGREYKNSNGKYVCIGMSKKVQDALGLPFDEFEAMSATIFELRNDLAVCKGRLIRCNSELDEMKKAGIMKRLKWLFLGVH